jgi:putative LysE/RhtB family amino acid efflux pump
VAQAVSAVLFGIAVAAPLGPIALLLIHTGLNRPLRAALAGALGVALADLSYALIALVAGSGLSTALRTHQHSLQAGSSILLVLLGLWLAAAALRRAAPESAGSSKIESGGLMRFYLLTLANPLTIVLFAGFAGQIHGVQVAAELLVFAGCLFLGSLVVQVSYASFGIFLQRWLRNASSIRLFNAASGAAIAAFGVHGLLG